MAKGSERNGVESAPTAPTTKKKNAKAASPKAPKKNDREVESPPPRSVEEFEPIAKLLTPNPPAWLNEYLHFLYWSVWRNWVLEREQPSRAELMRTLAEVNKAAAVLLRHLGSRPVVLEFLGVASGGPLALGKIGFLLAMLADVANWATKASELPTLVTPGGKTKPGQGRANPTKTIPARTFCALVIAESWKHFKGDYPHPKNRKAAEAAETYWLLSIGKKKLGWGSDELAAWTPHFRTARSAEGAKDRARICDHLREYEARRGTSKAEENLGDEN